MYVDKAAHAISSVRNIEQRQVYFILMFIGTTGFGKFLRQVESEQSPGVEVNKMFIIVSVTVVNKVIYMYYMLIEQSHCSVDQTFQIRKQKPGKL